MRNHRLALLVAAALVVAGTVLPVRLVEGTPVTRYAEAAAVPGVPVEPDWPASHLAVRWTGEHDDLVQLRWRGPAGWTGWELVLPDHDLEHGDQQMSQLVTVEAATAAEARAVAGDAADLVVVAIDTRHGPRQLVPTTQVAGAVEAVPSPPGEEDGSAGVPQPDVVSRSEWGADETLRKGDPSFATITRMAVHHTAGRNDDPDPKATIRAIYAYHTQGRGWNDIGYNFLIGPQGQVYEGRYARTYDAGEEPTGEDRSGRGVIGAHTGGNNTGTVGIAVLGEFTATTPPAAALDALRSLLAWEADRHGIDPLGTTTWSGGQQASTIIGHRDATATACPGTRLYDRLPAIRQEVANVVAAAHAARPTIGYRVLGRDTSVYGFGEAPSSVPVGLPPTAPGSSIATTPAVDGYWILSGGGRVTPYGEARAFGSTEDMKLNAPPVRLEPTPTGKGYWILGADGGVFAYGDAPFKGSTGAMKLNAPVISMAATPSGQGYWLLAKDGGVFTFGDARFYGSTGAMRLNAPVVSMAPHPAGRGYWLQAEDGGIFSFGAVKFHGSVPGLKLPPDKAATTVQIRSTGTGEGYYVLAADGRVFTFGDAPFHGERAGLSGAARATDLSLVLGPPAEEE